MCILFYHYQNAVRHNLSLHKCFCRVENVKGMGDDGAVVVVTTNERITLGYFWESLVNFFLSSSSVNQHTLPYSSTRICFIELITTIIHHHGIFESTRKKFLYIVVFWCGNLITMYINILGAVWTCDDFEYAKRRSAR